MFKSSYFIEFLSSVNASKLITAHPLCSSLVFLVFLVDFFFCSGLVDELTEFLFLPLSFLAILALTSGYCVAYKI